MYYLDFLFYALLILVPIFIIFGCLKKIYLELSGTNMTKARVLQIKNTNTIFTPDFLEEPEQFTKKEHTDAQVLYGIDQEGNHFYVKLLLRPDETAEVSLFLRLTDGTVYCLPNEPNVLSCGIHQGKWRAQGLSVYILEPYRRIRVVYNGLLKKFSNSQHTVEHVKINFIWNASDKPLFYPKDVHNTFISDAIQNKNYESVGLNEEHGYGQYGALQGLVTGEAFTDSLRLYLPCYRERSLCKVKHSKTNSVEIYVVGEDGTLFNIGVNTYQKGSVQLKYGSLLNNTGTVFAVTNHDLSLSNFGEAVTPSAMTIHLVANGKTFKCTLHLEQPVAETYNNTENGWLMKVVTARCMLNDQPAVGLVKMWMFRKGLESANIPRLLKESEVENCAKFVVPFTSKYCRTTKFAGGKGSSLGLLTSLNSKNFIVPEGFVVLASAFEWHVKLHPQLANGIQNIVDISCHKVEKDLEQTCKKVVELFSSTEIDSIMSQNILKLLHELNNSNDRWAVRSSGINEDSEDLSAAGQNATVLGCVTNEDVLKGVTTCWGSLFTFQSVQYRRQHGIDINTSMGVVIQRMVPSDKAGVIFTCHPTTGDPSKMVITSNFGIGESVVSGEVDPDTIIVKRTWNDELSIHSQEIGSKKHTVKMSNSGVDTITTNSEESSSLSLSIDEIIKLGKVGLELEKAYGYPRDIEWAFFQGKLYLLQSRPITTLTTWTDFELSHEFDTPVVTNQELYTIANTGEVFPGATSLLTFSTICQTIDKTTYKCIMNSDEQSFAMKFIGSLTHHVTINVTNCFLKKIGDKIDKSIQVLDMAIFGHLVVDENIHAVAKARVGTLTALGRLQTILYSVSEAIKINKYMKKVEELSKLKSLPLPEGKTALDTLNNVTKTFQSKLALFEFHSRVTHVNVFYQLVAINVLTEGSDSFTTEHYYDIALLLSSCSDVVSADVPKTLEKIVKILQDAQVATQFLSVTPDDGRKWLSENCPKASKEFELFLVKHGHRGIREFDLMFDSWGQNPALIIKMLQANCNSERTAKATVYLKPDETVAKLLTPKNNTVRKVLKFLVGKCRKSVGHRETTKSEVIRCINEFRIGIKKVAQQMVEEGTIPEHKLVYHLTMQELRHVLLNKNPELIYKATRRMRLHTTWDKIKIPELIFGFPKTEVENSITWSGKNRVVGTPVCPGEVVARACVITSLNDIKQLQTGDILITHSTDVGWSPYFPMLSAVVTELGGIISHGAVVAREYGLPCVVGVQNATEVFKTGDTVLLSGKLGVIELVNNC